MKCLIIPWIVFDRDQVKDFDEIIRLAEKKDINAGWSNPYFEIWMYAYFGEMSAIRESYTCCDRFAEKFEKVTGQKYFKKDRDIFRNVIKDETTGYVRNSVAKKLIVRRVNIQNGQNWNLRKLWSIF